jgi:hypothetical protein
MTCSYNDENLPNYRKASNCHGLDPSPFGLLLASLWGESLGTLKRPVADLKSNFCVKKPKINKLFILDNV